MGFAAVWVALMAGAAGALAKPAPRARMVVEDVLEVPDGHFIVVLKTEAEPYRYLPIWVGEGEAISIRLRLDGKRPPRPLTLNLLEAVLDSGKMKVIETAINDVRAGVFVGSVLVKQQGRAFALDARPSDAIGLAIGARAPIFVSKKVLDDAAIDASRLGLAPRTSDGDKKARVNEPEPIDYDQTL